MLGYLLRRVLAAIPVMGVVALVVFLLLRLTPGDPAAVLAGDNATTAQLERIRASLGLNEPLYIQFFTWIGKLLHGDLGHHPLGRYRGAARRGRSLEARHLDRPLRDGIVGARFLRAGVRDRLCPDQDLC